MKRYIQYIIIALLASFTAVSCLEELEPETPVFENEVLTLVPRVQSFANQYVTKAGEGDAEIKSLAVLIFNNGGSLVHKQEFTDFENAFVNINKTMLNLNTPTEEQKLTEATVVMIANMPLANIKNSDEESLADVTNLTLEGLNTYTYTLTDAQAIITEKPTTGFPMVGNATVNLSHTYTEAIGVELNILYAKINFSISVTSGSENQGDGVSFTLEKYTVNNVAKEITLMKPEAETATSSYYSGFTNEPKNTTDLSSNKDPLKFTFYMLESRYEHNLSSTQISSIYPWGTSAGYESYQQMYKPQLVTASGKGIAPNVLLSGQYSDYRGTKWDVKYTVYLGKDNAQNFQVDRNSEYTNIITIKGIRNNDDYGVGQVWLDHRVDVEYSGSDADDLVKITRETLIDSHIEVRPLRVKWNEGDYDGVRVYLPTKSKGGSLVDWIGIEKFTDNNGKDASVYCYIKGIPTGKRKYFTTTLIKELQTMGGEFGVETETDGTRKFLDLKNNECVWIYFDENQSTDIRTATITLEFYSSKNNNKTEDYNIKQQGLNLLGGYYVESYEEYLHSYDSDDKYDLSTSPVDYTQQGLSWGFKTDKLSKHMIVNATSIPDRNDRLKNALLEYYSYDYFSESDGSSYSLYTNSSGSWAAGSFGTGIDFTRTSTIQEEIPIKDMGTIPDNAYQYCLSKNKFNVDEKGKVSMMINWYLPDVHELKSILRVNQSKEGDSLSDIASEAYYWSSQPAFERIFNIKNEIVLGLLQLLGIDELSLINEIQDEARAVSVQGDNSEKNLGRNELHRIRCVYKSEGKPVNSEEMKVPDGIGGNYPFYMKAWYNGEAGYFNSYMKSDATRTDNEEDPEYEEFFDDTKKYPYPTVDSPGERDIFTSFSAETQGGSTVKGFRLYPLNMDLWQGYKKTENTGGIFDYEEFTYYKVLATFPGLSGYELKYDDGFGGDGGARPLTDQPRVQKEIKTIHYEAKLDKTLDVSTKLKSLDPEGKLNIKFSNNTNPHHAPIYNYDALEENSRKMTSTRTWRVPTYRETTYTPKKGDDTESFDGKASASAERKNSWGKWDKTEEATITEAETSAKNNALADAMNKAQSKYIGRTCAVVENHIEITGGSWRKNILRQNVEYTANASGKVKIRCYDPEDPTPLTYFMDASNGGWSDPKPASNPEYLDEIKTDELKIYCGNSLTISCADGYEISSIKLYCSGNNFIVGKDGMSFGTLKIPQKYYYARFVESTTKLPGEKNKPVSGMDYIGDFGDDTSTHIWSGAGKNSVTLVLADYYCEAKFDIQEIASNIMAGKFDINNILEFVPFDYQYLSTNIDYDKHIVIDHIEVKCTPKSTSSN